MTRIQAGPDPQGVATGWAASAAGPGRQSLHVERAHPTPDPFQRRAHGLQLVLNLLQIPRS